MNSETPGIYRRVLSGFAWQGTTKFLVQAISWVSTIVVARLLEPSDYGVMAVANVFLWMMLTFMNMGLSQALVHQSEVSREDEDAIFSLSLLLGVALFIAILLLAPVVAEFYRMPLLTGVMQLCAVGLVISSVKAVPQAILMRRLDFRSRALVEVWGSLAATTTVISLALLDYGVWSLAWGMLVQHTVVTIGFLPIMKRRPRLTLDFARIAAMVRYGLHLMGSNMAFVISSRSDVFIIGKVLGDHATGVYSLAYQFATIPLDKIGTLFNHVAFPSMARVKQDDQQCRTLFVELHRYLIFLGYPVLIGMAVVADDMVAVLLGTKWLQAAPILQALCVVNVARISGMLISPALNSRGRERDALRYSLVGAVLLPMAFLIGVQFGLKGVAFAWVIAYPFLYAMLLRALYADLRIALSDLINDSQPTMIATTVMMVAVLGLQHLALAPALRLGVSVGAGAVVYASVFLLFYGEQVARMWRALRELRSDGAA